MFSKLVVEFLGTVIFIIIILSTGNPLAIGITLAAMIYLGSIISGGNYNPAVTLSNYLNGTLTGMELGAFILVQFIAAFIAFTIYKKYYV